MKNDNWQQDVQEWFEITLKNVSGGLGFPSHASDWAKPFSHSTKRFNPVPAAAMPPRLHVTDKAMTRIDSPYYNVLMAKYMVRGSDKDRAEWLGIKVNDYYKRLREARLVLMGAYLVSD